MAKIIGCGKSGFAKAAEEALAKLVNLLGIQMQATEEFDLTGKITPAPPGNVHTFSYHVSPVSFWIYIVEQNCQYLPISAMTVEGKEYRIFSFVYDRNLQFDHIEEIQGGQGRQWMLIVGSKTRE